jgi:hypothetical protein
MSSATEAPSEEYDVQITGTLALTAASAAPG